MKHFKIIALALVLLLITSCTFMYVPLIPANPQMRDARFLMSESEGLSVEAEQLRLDISIKEIPESDWLAVQWFSPLSKEVASDSKWLEVAATVEDALDGLSLNFMLPDEIDLTPGYWRAVVSYQGRLIRQFGFDYAVVSEEDELNESESSETNPAETPNESTQNEAN